MNKAWWIERGAWLCTNTNRVLLRNIEGFEIAPVLTGSDPRRIVHVHTQAEHTRLWLECQTEKEATQTVNEMSEAVEKALGLGKKHAFEE